MERAMGEDAENVALHGNRNIVRAAPSVVAKQGGGQKEMPSSESAAQRTCVPDTDSADATGPLDVVRVKQDVGRALDKMENLVWWTCSEAQKESWKLLLADVRACINELEAELDRTKQGHDEARAALDQSLRDLEAARARQAPELALPPWVSDWEREACHGCKSEFSLFRRRHHCRSCGELFCGECSDHYVPVPHWGYTNPVRVCAACHETSEASRRAPTQAAAAQVPPTAAKARLSFLGDIKARSSKDLLKQLDSPMAKATLKPARLAALQRGGVASSSSSPAPPPVIDELRKLMLKRRTQIHGGVSPGAPTIKKGRVLAARVVEQERQSLALSTSPMGSPLSAQSTPRESQAA